MIKIKFPLKVRMKGYILESYLQKSYSKYS